jgi:UDPglucose--hexose-1-phosphate uridylyltransferase
VHHTITPIARKREDFYEIDLVLRDNNTSNSYPDGIFHPHPELHHIKKENIGLIEVMGLAILPPRLKDELAEVEKYLLGQACQLADKHRQWADKLKKSDDFTAENVEAKVRAAVGEIFVQVLKDAGVFKSDAAGQAGFKRFIRFVNEG